MKQEKFEEKDLNDVLNVMTKVKNCGAYGIAFSCVAFSIGLCADIYPVAMAATGALAVSTLITTFSATTCLGSAMRLHWMHKDRKEHSNSL